MVMLPPSIGANLSCHGLIRKPPCVLRLLFALCSHASTTPNRPKPSKLHVARTPNEPHRLGVRVQAVLESLADRRGQSRGALRRRGPHSLAQRGRPLLPVWHAATKCTSAVSCISRGFSLVAKTSRRNPIGKQPTERLLLWCISGITQLMTYGAPPTAKYFKQP